jgi:coenzyme PQQ precursor peptide PqqA
MRPAAGADTLEPAWRPDAYRLGSTNARYSMADVPFDQEVPVMKWETPQASDQRFGFENTMYISTR